MGGPGGASAEPALHRTAETEGGQQREPRAAEQDGRAHEAGCNIRRVGERWLKISRNIAVCWAELPRVRTRQAHPHQAPSCGFGVWWGKCAERCCEVGAPLYPDHVESLFIGASCKKK